MKRRQAALALLLLSSAFLPSSAAPLYQCTFAKDGWNPADWILVKSPRWDHFGKWVQRDGYVENETPAGATTQDLLGKLAPQTYTSMVLGRKVSGNITVRSTMEFGDRMAPLIVLAPELGKSKEGTPEYREHWEVVIFDQGVNVWHHVFTDGKPSWKKAAYWTFELKPKTKYTLEVAKKGKQLSVTVDGRTMGYLEGSLPEDFHVGITGCEGANRFYDLSVEQ
jgi:hypothetical protein